MICTNCWAQMAGEVQQLMISVRGQTYEMDGPAALSYVFDAFMGTRTYKTVTYPAEVLLAATWNVDGF